MEFHYYCIFVCVPYFHLGFFSSIIHNSFVCISFCICVCICVCICFSSYIFILIIIVAVFATIISLLFILSYNYLLVLPLVLEMKVCEGCWPAHGWSTCQKCHFIEVNTIRIQSQLNTQICREINFYCILFDYKI